MLATAQRVLTMTYGTPLSKVEREIDNFSLSPGHGSGATSDRLRGNRKWTFPTWHQRLQHVFPWERYAMINENYWKRRASVKFLQPEEETPSKLVAIPKTATKPRLIAAEPTCMQYIQQGMMKSLVGHLEAEEPSKWFVGFTDQVPNQTLAMIGSADQSLATLDLSDASDSVANWLVEALFENFPTFGEAAGACRTRRVKLPSGEVLDLQKYASMGSALTFPIEAVVFSTIALCGVLEHRGQTPTPKTIKSLRSTVRVYGDDLIVPTDAAETVIFWLETFGFKVNKDKSFWTGEFRESCGKEYWKGRDVSIVKVRKAFPSSRRDVDEVISTVATRNLFYKTGLEQVAGTLDEILEEVLQHFPWVSEESPVLGRVHKSGFYQIDSWCPKRHTPLVKGYVPRSPIPVNGLDGSDALLKCLLSTIGNPDIEKDHLARSGRPRDVSMYLSKATPF